MTIKNVFWTIVGLGGSLLAASAGELFYTNTHDGSLYRLDTSSLEHELVSAGHAIPNNISSGPTGIVFRSPNVLFISADGNFNGEAALHHYHYDAGELTLISTRKTTEKMWRLNSGVLSREGLIYMPSRYGYRLWSFGSDAYETDGEGVQRNVGPFPANQAETGKYPRHIAYSWIDGRLAVSHEAGIYLYTTDGGVVTFERDISIAGVGSVAGLAFDYDGLPVLDAEGNEIGRKSLLYISNKATKNILRFDATTGEPLGANPEDPSDPTFISAADAGFVELGQFAIDPADGHFYVNNRNEAHRDQWGNVGGWVLSRFSRTGSMLNTVVVPNIGIRQMTFRPTVRQMEILADGDYVLGPDGFAIQGGSAGVSFQAALGVNRAVMDFFGDGSASFAGDVSVGGDDSGNVVVQLRDASVVKTIKLNVDKNGAVRVLEQSTVEVDGGARVSGGILDVADGTMHLKPGSDIGSAAVATVSNGGSIIAAGGGNIIAAGGGNIISTGGGNIISTGGGNIISTGGGNIIAAGGGNIISTGGGNIVSRTTTTFRTKVAVTEGTEEGGGIEAVDADIIAGDGGSIICETGGSLDARTIILEAGGGMSTGENAGIATLGADLDARAGSSLIVKLGGLSKGDEYDAYQIGGGTASLNGRLEIFLMNGFATSITENDSFTILSAGSGITGLIENLSEGRVQTADASGSFSVRISEDGNDLVLEDFQPSTPFNAWKGLHFSSSDLLNAEMSGDSADPDQDGLVNLAEFAFNLNPRAFDSSRAFSIRPDENSVLRLTYRRRVGGVGTEENYVAAGIRYELMESTDLRSWQRMSLSEAPSVESQVTPDPDDQTEWVTLFLDPTSEEVPAQFYRIQISAE